MEAILIKSKWEADIISSGTSTGVPEELLKTFKANAPYCPLKIEDDAKNELKTDGSRVAPAHWGDAKEKDDVIIKIKKDIDAIDLKLKDPKIDDDKKKDLTRERENLDKSLKPKQAEWERFLPKVQKITIVCITDPLKCNKCEPILLYGTTSGRSGVSSKAAGTMKDIQGFPESSVGMILFCKCDPKGH